MITTFKLFESIEEPEEGDYVIVKLKNSPKNFNMDDVTNNNIGKIQRKFISETTPKFIFYHVVYNNLGIDTWAESDEIVDFSNNKEDLQYILQGNKYNL